VNQRMGRKSQIGRAKGCRQKRGWIRGGRVPAKFLHPFLGIGGAGGPPSPPIMPDFIHFRDRGSTRGNALIGTKFHNFLFCTLPMYTSSSPKLVNISFIYVPVHDVGFIIFSMSVNIMNHDGCVRKLSAEKFW
jgi:hypothetical protein